MADNLPVPSGSDGQLVVTVDSRQALAGLRAIEIRMLEMGENVNRGMNKMSTGFDRFVGFIKKATVAVAGFMVVQKGFAALTASIEHMMSRVIEINRVYTGFIASMNVIKGSTAAATKEYEFLLAISNKLGVAVETSITQYHRLAASLKNVDTTGELTRHIFSGISQAAVVLHARGRDVTLMFEAVQQMASKGKLSLEELQRQLGNTLPGAMGLAARAMMESKSFIEAGVKNAAEAEQRLRKGIEKGTINVYEFLLLLSNQLKKEYGAGVQYAADQFTANFNRMKNSVFEFYRMVGSSGAMEGLTEIVREVTALFNDGGQDGAFGLGKALGDSFKDVASWIRALDSTDVAQFFATVQGLLQATGIMVQGFFEMWKGFEGPEMETPLLNFVQFVAGSMAGLMDVISMTVAGIRMLFNNLASMWIDIKNMFSGGELGESAVNAVDRLGNRMGIQIPGRGARNKYREFRANVRSERYENDVKNTDLVAQGERAFSDTDSMHARTNARFEELRRQVLSVGTRKAGTTADAAAGYVNPLGDADLQKLMEQVLANSGAPNQGKPKGAGSKEAKEAEQALRRQVREFEKLENQVSKWRQEVGITERAEERLRLAKEQLTEAVGKLDPVTGKLLLTQKEADKIMERLNEKYAEALDPMKYLMDQYDRQAKGLKFIGDEAKYYTEILKQQEEWREKNIEWDEKDIANLRAKLVAQSELSRIQKAMDDVLGRTTYGQRDEMDRIRATGMLGRGYEDPEGNKHQISKGDMAKEAVDIFGEDRMKGTEEYYEAQYEIYLEFLEKVRAAREEGLVSEETSNQLEFDAWWNLQLQKTEGMRTALGTMAGLMNSHNKKMFKIGQTAAIAEAIINTAVAATKAWKDYGWPWGAVAAAATVAMGAIQISQIRSQKPPGYRTGGSYKVGGGGGHDTKRVTFDATPGELIQINTPSQAKAAERIAANLEDGSVERNARPINMPITIVQSGRPDRKTPRQQAKAIRKQAEEVVNQ